VSILCETILRDGRPDDWLYIDSLRKKEGNALGFIPQVAYKGILEKRMIAGRERWKYSRILITEDNGDRTGYCYASFGNESAKIFQICVQEDARRWHRALMMTDEIEREAIKRGNLAVTCRVAFDLESNDFWKAIGYIPIKKVVSTWLNQRESKTKRQLWIYKKTLQPKLF